MQSVRQHISRLLWIGFVLFLAAVLVLLFTQLFGWARQAIPYDGEVDPLLSGQAPESLSLHVFETGNMSGLGMGVYVGGSGEIDLDQPAFVIEHPTYGLIMFEAGFHPNISTEGSAYVGEWLYTTGLLAMSQDVGQDARSQMALAGFDPTTVKVIVPSHFHPEHAGAIETFPQAQIAIDNRELDYIMEYPKYNFFPKEYDDVTNWWVLDFKQSWLPFDGAIDVVGDGSIYIVSTPGHTPGHLSMLLNLPQGPVFLIGDVAWTIGNLESTSIGIPFISVDGRAARESLGTMLSFSEVYPDVLLVPGHDLDPLRESPREDVTLYPWP